MSMKRLVVSLAAFLFAAMLATPASASYVDPSGLEFSFFNLGLVGPAGDLVGGDNDTYDIKVVVDYSNYSGPDTDYMYAVSIGVGAYDDATLQSTTAPGAWSFEDGGLNANGCSGASDVQMCAEDGQSAVLGGTGSYEWIFRVDTTSGIGVEDDPNTPEDETGFIHLKALWQHNDGNPGIEDDSKAGGLISTDFPFDDVTTDEDDVDLDLDTPVPEPGSLLLLGSGLVAAAARLRRRNQ